MASNSGESSNTGHQQYRGSNRRGGSGNRHQTRGNSRVVQSDDESNRTTVLPAADLSGLVVPAEASTKQKNTTVVLDHDIVSTLHIAGECANYTGNLVNLHPKANNVFVALVLAATANNNTFKFKNFYSCESQLRVHCSDYLRYNSTYHVAALISMIVKGTLGKYKWLEDEYNSNDTRFRLVSGNATIDDVKENRELWEVLNKHSPIRETQPIFDALVKFGFGTTNVTRSDGKVVCKVSAPFTYPSHLAGHMRNLEGSERQSFGVSVNIMTVVCYLDMMGLVMWQRKNQDSSSAAAPPHSTS